jgi:hypothetical protein
MGTMKSHVHSSWRGKIGFPVHFGSSSISHYLRHF